MDYELRPQNAEDGQVLKFRPRKSSALPKADLEWERSAHGPGSDNFGRFAQKDAVPDDYRQRMVANVVAFVFIVLLTAAGIWLVTKIADLRQTQDCVLMGRRDCGRVSVPHS